MPSKHRSSFAPAFASSRAYPFRKEGTRQQRSNFPDAADAFGIRLTSLLASFFLTLSLHAQNPEAVPVSSTPQPAAITRDVFFLIDVSGSVPQADNKEVRGKLQKMITEARLLASRLVSGEFKTADFPDWRINDALLRSPLLEIVTPGNSTQRMSGVGKRAIIVPFGDKAVDHPAATSPPFQNFPSEFHSFVETNYPTAYRDQNTYVTLAHARTAALAESLQIKQYYFLVITDAIQDPKAAYTDEEKKLIASWDSENFVPKKTRIGLFNYAEKGLESRDFQIDVWQVDLVLPLAEARIVTKNPVPAQQIPPGPVTVSWSIASGPSGAESQPAGYSYFLSLLNPETGALLQSLSVKGQYTATLPIDLPGNYRLTITGSRHEPGTDTLLPDALGQSDTLLTVAKPAMKPKVKPLPFALEIPPLFAEEESTLRWTANSVIASEAPPAGKLKVTITEVAGQKEVDPILSGNELKVAFPRPGDYTLRFELYPTEPVPDLAYYSLDKTLSVSAKRTTQVQAKKEKPADDLALQFLLPRHNSTINTKKVVFRWSVPPTEIPITQYRLRVTGPERFDQTSPTAGFAKTFTKPGRYMAQLSVSAPPELTDKVESTQIAFTIEGGGGGALWLLLLFLGGAAGYYFWRRKQTNSKSKKPA